MPELPDIAAYLVALEPRIVRQTLERVRLQSVFVLRTADPPIASVEEKPSANSAASASGSPSASTAEPLPKPISGSSFTS